MSPIQIIGGGSDQALFVPAVRAYRNTNQSVAAAAFSEVLFDKEDFDNAEMHSLVSNTGRLVAPKAGIYEITFQYALFQATNSTTGINEAVIVKNGSVNINAVRYGMEPNGEGIVQISATLKLEGGDYVTCLAYNASGSARNISSAEGTMVWIGSGLKTAVENYDWGIVTALPSAARVGDYCSLKVREESGKPWKLWRLQKVEEEGERPWVKIGGPPLRAEVAGNTTVSANAYSFTGMPGLPKLPFNIEAILSHGMSLMSDGVAEVNQMETMPFYGPNQLSATGAVSAGEPVYFIGVAQFNGAGGNHRWTSVIPKENYVYYGWKSLSAKSSTLYFPWIELDPIRVG